MSRTLHSLTLLTFLFASSSGLLAQGPVAWYPFNGNADDASGNGHDGTVHGAELTLDRFGNCNSAYAFNGEEKDVIEVSESRALSFGRKDFTVISWVKFCQEQPEYAGLVCKGPPNNSYPGYQLHIASGNKFTTQIGDAGNRADEKRALQELNDGQWHMLTVAVSPKANQVTLYIDGEEVKEYQQISQRQGDLDVSRYSPTSLLIGTERNRDRYFSGLIDDIRLYDRLLDIREITFLYHENGWDKETRSPEPYITLQMNACDREKATLSVGCYPQVRWSTGETSKEITVSRSGRYQAFVSDGSGCSAQEVVIGVRIDSCEDDLHGNEDTGGVAGAEIAGQLSGSGLTTRLYPNPAANEVRIALETPLSGQIRAELLDLQGRDLGIGLEQEVGSGSHHLVLPTKELSNGTYLVRITTGGETVLRRIVVQH